MHPVLGEGAGAHVSLFPQAMTEMSAIQSEMGSLVLAKTVGNDSRVKSNSF